MPRRLGPREPHVAADERLVDVGVAVEVVGIRHDDDRWRPVRPREAGDKVERKIVAGLDDVRAELERREGVGGLVEKAARTG